jgi:uncharacterized membrane protein
VTGSPTAGTLSRSTAGTDAVRVPGLVLGLGLGGFLDGIVLHQLLNWHHMLSSWYPLTSPHRERINMVGDGLFHLLCWLLVVAGIVLLVRATSRPEPGVGRRIFGWTVAGWGVFNIVEGIIDHFILGVHHVHPQSHQLAYDLGFLVLGAALTVAGWALGRRAPHRPNRAR